MPRRSGRLPAWGQLLLGACALQLLGNLAAAQVFGVGLRTRGLRSAAPAAPVSGGLQALDLSASSGGSSGDAEDGGTTSAVRCVGEDFSASSWVARSCHFRNACVETGSGTWRYFRGTGAEGERPDDEMVTSLGAINNEWLGDRSKNPAIEEGLRLRVLGTDGTAEDFAERMDLPLLHAPAGDVAVPYHEFCAANPGHLLWDDMFAWFQLVRIFHLEGLRLMPLRKSMEEPPWATCDWIERNPQHLPPKYYQKCIDTRARWFPGLLGQGVTDVRRAPAHGDFWKGVTVDGSTPPEKALVCFPHLASGIAMLSDHCLGDHGKGTKWRPWNHAAANDKKGQSAVRRGDMLEPSLNEWEGLPAIMTAQCNSRVSPSMWKYRSALASSLLPGWPFQGGGPQDPKVAKIWGDIPRGKGVLIQQYSKTFKGLGFGFEGLKSKLEARGLPAVVVQMAGMSPAQQVELVEHAGVFVSQSGGATISAMFLPDGAGMLLCYSDSPDGGHKFDWQLWEHIAYIRTRWHRAELCNRGDDASVGKVMELLRGARHFIPSGAPPTGPPRGGAARARAVGDRAAEVSERGRGWRARRPRRERKSRMGRRGDGEGREE